MKIFIMLTLSAYSLAALACEPMAIPEQIVESEEVQELLLDANNRYRAKCEADPQEIDIDQRILVRRSGRTRYYKIVFSGNYDCVRANGSGFEKEFSGVAQMKRYVERSDDSCDGVEFEEIYKVRLK